MQKIHSERVTQHSLLSKIICSQKSEHAHSHCKHTELFKAVNNYNVIAKCADHDIDKTIFDDVQKKAVIVHLLS